MPLGYARPVERMSSLVVLAIAVACGPQVAIEADFSTDVGTGTSGAQESSTGGQGSTRTTGADDDAPGSPVTTAAMTTSAPDPASTSDTGPAPGTSEDTAPGDTSDEGPVGCEPPCRPGERCIAGICFGEPDDTGGGWCPAWGKGGNYDSCFAGDDVCDGGICIVDDPMDPGFATCTPLGCTDVCDCPEPLEQGTLVCDVITTDMQTGCFFTCGGGNGCPPGMICLPGFVCAWPR